MNKSHELTCSFNWSHMLSAANVKRYPLDHLIKLLLLTTRTFLKLWWAALLVVAPPFVWKSCTSFHTRSTSISVLTHPSEVTYLQSPLGGSSAMFDSVGTPDIQALKAASNSIFKCKSKIGLEFCCLEYCGKSNNLGPHHYQCR